MAQFLKTAAVSSLGSEGPNKVYIDTTVQGSVSRIYYNTDGRKGHPKSPLAVFLFHPSDTKVLNRKGRRRKPQWWSLGSTRGDKRPKFFTCIFFLLPFMKNQGLHPIQFPLPLGLLISRHPFPPLRLARDLLTP